MRIRFALCVLHGAKPALNRSFRDAELGQVVYTPDSDAARHSFLTASPHTPFLRSSINAWTDSF